MLKVIDMKNNRELQKDVQDAIKCEPLLSAAKIAVVANEGVITLTGTVNSYARKLEAENAAKNVPAVKAVVENIEVKFSSLGERSDIEIAKEVLNALKLNSEVPDSKLKVTVENGHVTLEGEVQWNYEREAAKKSVSNLAGVKVFTNNISIKSETHDEIEKHDIERALVRNWSVDHHEIQVGVLGNTVTLNGIVHSFYQRDEAERIAWNVPGASNVDNKLVIDYAD